MKILITGVNGFLGYYFIEKLIANGHYVIATGKGENKLPFNNPYFVYEIKTYKLFYFLKLGILGIYR